MNPYFAQVNIKLGDLELNSTPEHFVDMSHVLKGKGVSESLVISLYDDTALLLESEIQQHGKDKLQISYGYTDGEMSQVYKLRILKYGISFVGQGALLKLECSTSAQVKSTKTAKKSYSGKLISEIVEEIAKEEKWEIGVIVKTAPVKAKNTDRDDADNQMTFLRENESAKDFIERKLKPLAISEEEGKGDYVFSLLSTDSGGVKVYFMPTGYEDNTKETQQAQKKEYKFVVGQKSEFIRSFTPEFNETLTALLGGKAVKASAQDPYTGEYSSAFIRDENDTQDTVTRHIASTSYSYDQMLKISTNLYHKARNLSYKAKMSINGDPNIKPMTVIPIVVVNKDGFIHHSTGKYFIESVEHIIKSGDYVTILSLVKNHKAKTAKGVNGTGVYSAETSGFVFERSDGVSRLPDTVPRSEVLKACESWQGIPYVENGSTKQEGMDSPHIVASVLNEVKTDLNAQGNISALRGLGSSQSVGDVTNYNTGDLLFWTNTPSSQLNSDMANQLIESAKAYLGQDGTNIWAHRGLATDTPWCAAFISTALDDAGVPSEIVNRTNLADGFEGEHLDPHSYTPVPGDLVMFDWNGGSDVQHAGIVTGIADDTHITTIEGNTGLDSGGRGVAEKTRGIGNIVYYIHPSYPIDSDVEVSTDNPSHVAVYVGGGYVFHSNKAYGSSGFFKITSVDEKGIVEARTGIV